MALAQVDPFYEQRSKVSSFLLSASAVGLLISTTVGRAEEPKDSSGIPESSIARSFPNHGDAWGRRAELARHGVTYGLNYAAEAFGVADGGIKSGASYFGQFEAVFDIDFDKLRGWPGLTFHMSAMQLHGRGISATHVGILDPVSSIEATPATRLVDFWLEKELLKDKVTVRFGQMRVDADGEFLNAPNAGLFLTTSFGWPAFMASNLPSGGVSYPLAAPGIRVKFVPARNFAMLVAVFNDDPAGLAMETLNCAITMASSSGCGTNPFSSVKSNTNMAGLNCLPRSLDFSNWVRSRILVTSTISRLAMTAYPWRIQAATGLPGSTILTKASMPLLTSRSTAPWGLLKRMAFMHLLALRVCRPIATSSHSLSMRDCDLSEWLLADQTTNLVSRQLTIAFPVMPPASTSIGTFILAPMVLSETAKSSAN